MQFAYLGNVDFFTVTDFEPSPLESTIIPLNYHRSIHCVGTTYILLQQALLYSALRRT